MIIVQLYCVYEHLIPAKTLNIMINTFGNIGRKVSVDYLHVIKLVTFIRLIIINELIK